MLVITIMTQKTKFHNHNSTKDQKFSINSDDGRLKIKRPSSNSSRRCPFYLSVYFASCSRPTYDIMMVIYSIHSHSRTHALSHSRTLSLQSAPNSTEQNNTITRCKMAIPALLKVFINYNTGYNLATPSNP